MPTEDAQLTCNYVPSWQHGVPAAFDFAITSPVRQDMVALTAQSCGAAAKAYEQTKKSFLNTASDCQQQGFSFIPIVGESSGGLGPSASWVFKTIANSIANSTGRDAGAVLREHRQALGVLLRQANARAIFSRDPGTIASISDPLTSASVALSSFE